jgi:hypothetical protein
MKNKLDVPKPSEERGNVESVSSFPQHGQVTEAQLTVDGGIEAGGDGRWVGDGADIRYVKNGA